MKTDASIIELELEKDSLLTCLLEVSPALTDNELGWFLFECDLSGNVTISAVNQVMAIKSQTMALQVKKSIKFKVQGRQLVEYLKQLPGEKSVKIKVEPEKKIHISSGRSRASFSLVQDSNEIDVRLPNNGASLTISPMSLEKWISSFRDFVLVDDNRFYANGALLFINSETPQSITSVASDSLRLAKSSVELVNTTSNNEPPQKILVPRKVLDELRRLAANTEDAFIQIYMDEKSLTFAAKTNRYTLSAKCIAGVYPPYESAIPKETLFQVIVPVNKLCESLKRVIIFDSYCQLKFSNLGLSVSCGHKSDEAEEWIELDPQSVNHESFEVKYNAKHLLSILNHISTESAHFAWENTQRPVIIQAHSTPPMETFYLLVPMNI